MKLKDLIKELDAIFDMNLALPGDPAGLQIGKINSEIKSVLLTLDITEDVIGEAVAEKTDLVITHHPLIFKPLPEIVSSSMISSKIIKLIESRIAVYTAHTGLDSGPDGLNDYIAERMGLKNIRVMEKSGEQWYKFTVFVPPEAESKIRDAICRSGGGKLGNYSCCTFNTMGTGTFKPLNGANPYTGNVGSLSSVGEVRIECVVGQNALENLVREVLKEHPYEEPAYDIYKIENRLTPGGLGRSGIADPSCAFEDFMEKIIKSLDLKNFRWLCVSRNTTGRMIKNVAVINGSANFFADRLSKGAGNHAVWAAEDYSTRASAHMAADPVSSEFNSGNYDIIITGELRYHNAMQIAESGTIVVEIGHGESEKLCIELMHEKLSAGLKNLKEVKLVKSKTGFIPWRYYIE